MSEPNPPIERIIEKINPDRSTNGAKRIDPERQRIFNVRIESCRRMLRLNWTQSDIIKAFKLQHGIGRRQTIRYLGHARQRNNQILDYSEDERLADAISYWSNRLQEHDARVLEAGKQHQDATAALPSALEALNASTSVAELKAALAVLEELNRTLDNARRTLYTAEKFAMEARDRIDKLYGVAGPQKIRIVDSQGDDIPAHPSEPVSIDQGQKRVDELLEILKQRQSANPN